MVDSQRGFQGFSNVRWFSEKEKDEIDVLVGVGLKKCVQGVRALEAADQGTFTWPSVIARVHSQRANPDSDQFNSSSEKAACRTAFKHI